MEIRLPSRLDRSGGESLTDDDERALDAIRHQLDIEFAHSTDTVAGTAPPAARRRVRAATVLSVLLVCASAGAATMLVTPVYQALTAPPVDDRESRSAAQAPVAVTSSVGAAHPASPTVSPPRAEPSIERASRRQATPTPQPAPDVIRLRVAPPASPKPAAPATVPPPVVESVASPAPAALAAAPPRVVTPPVERGAEATPAPTTSLPPVESAVAAVAPLPFMEFASEHVRAAWGTVKERVLRATGELPHGARSGPEAP